MLRMKKSLLIFSMSFTLMLAVPTLVTAVTVAPGIEEFIDEDITITVNGQTATISGAQGQTLEVISLTGRRVMTVKIEPIVLYGPSCLISVHQERSDPRWHSKNRSGCTAIPS